MIGIVQIACFLKQSRADDDRPIEKLGSYLMSCQLSQGDHGRRRVG